MLTRHLRAAARRGISSAGRAAPVNSCTASSGLQVVGQALVRPSIVSRAAPFHTSSAFRKGLMPDSDDPEPPNNEVPREPGHVLEPTPINDEEFNAMAMSYLEVVALRAETAHPHGSRLEVEPVFDALNITRPGHGNFALAKNPEKKQLMLTTPSSEQRAFDWVLRGGGMNQKQDTDHHENLGGSGWGQGDWIDLKDGSDLSTLLDEELQLGMVENFK